MTQDAQKLNDEQRTVRRYNVKNFYEAKEHPLGEFVEYQNYEALRNERKGLEDKVNELDWYKKWFDELNGHATVQKTLENWKGLEDRVRELEKRSREDGLLGQASLDEANNRVKTLEAENEKLKAEASPTNSEAQERQRAKDKAVEGCRKLKWLIDVHQSQRREVGKGLQDTNCYDFAKDALEALDSLPSGR